MELGQVINQLIKNRNLTQVELAKQIGKSTTALSQIIRGTYNPSPSTLNKISKALDVPVPILHFLTISEKDIPDDKISLYRMLEPSLKAFIMEIFGVEKLLLKEEINLN